MENQDQKSQLEQEITGETLASTEVTESPVSPVSEEEAPNLSLELTEETPSEEVPVVEEELAQEEGLDRSVYNCPDCSGEGLKDEFNVCRRCGGSGKV